MRNPSKLRKCECGTANLTARIQGSEGSKHDWFELVKIDPAIAMKGGLYRREFFRSHGTGLADALIAASTDFVSATLITLNKKHFPMLKKVTVPYRKH